MSSPEDSPHPIPPADTFIRAARFPDQDTAGVVYFAAQTWLATAEPALNVSVFRLQYAEWWAVAAIGLLPPTPVLQALEALLATGAPLTLPPAIATVLWERRRRGTQLGPWVERHERPGDRGRP